MDEIDRQLARHESQSHELDRSSSFEIENSIIMRKSSSVKGVRIPRFERNIGYIDQLNRQAAQNEQRVEEEEEKLDQISNQENLHDASVSSFSQISQYEEEKKDNRCERNHTQRIKSRQMSNLMCDCQPRILIVDDSPFNI